MKYFLSLVLLVYSINIFAQGQGTDFSFYSEGKSYVEKCDYINAERKFNAFRGTTPDDFERLKK